jgi:uncharacterized membrane protein
VNDAFRAAELSAFIERPMKREHIVGVHVHSSRSTWFAVCCCFVATCSPILAQTAMPENASVACRVKAYGAKGDGIALDTFAIGADLMNSGLPVASINGAGMLEGVFLVGIVAVLPASLMQLGARREV